MSRELKFRVWDSVDKVFIGEYDIYDGCPYHHDKSRREIMQFTGLHDKNGKEIYEGDIVRILYTDWCSKKSDDPRTIDQYLIDISSVGIVSFNKSSWSIFFRSNKGEYYDCYDSIYPGKHGIIEVIGNKHENPELLNK